MSSSVTDVRSLPFLSASFRVKLPLWNSLYHLNIVVR
ncbi:unnamed protein product [Acanthoscelides obtectus]|uniref:Uncharacterized protein n=1 Tax=Acanthoscelides obtectus TaxID=200917 RepID=A0A9P0JPP8_ACAOB|nr:unnamed protein product [Acanthoscelides obtectus]CAK1621172.1 hypothetical protein AOBTE_LOCUS808 [Acanthoscelides obtectus]